MNLRDLLADREPTPIEEMEEVIREHEALDPDFYADPQEQALAKAVELLTRIETEWPTRPFARRSSYSSNTLFYPYPDELR